MLLLPYPMLYICNTRCPTGVTGNGKAGLGAYFLMKRAIIFRMIRNSINGIEKITKIRKIFIPIFHVSGE